MTGHVNVMDDVLISNRTASPGLSLTTPRPEPWLTIPVPPAYLRSALRTLLSQGPVNQRPFVEHIRSRLQETPPQLTDPSKLFPSHDVPSAECVEYLALTRCVFSSKLAGEALTYLTHFVTSIAQARASWTPQSPLTQHLHKFAGDVVQAMQALKESAPEKTTPLRENLLALLASLVSCQTYCASSHLEYPFARAERQVRDTLQLFFPDAAVQPNQAVSSREQQLLQVSLPPDNAVDTFALGDRRLPRLFNGLWQLSSPAFGVGDSAHQQRKLVQLVEKGLVAADMADHYGDAELVYGDFRNSLPPAVRGELYAATKWCVFKPINVAVTKEYVLAAVRERCRRLGGRVDLLQFHWYDYEAKEYLEILRELVAITKSHPELLSAVGLCNFDALHTEEICRYLVDRTGEVGIVSNQVQFSPIDTRPLMGMTQVCERYNLKLLTYGSLCGGLLSEKWLNHPPPDRYSPTNPLNPSQRKYLDMINHWGTWNEFQALLRTLSLLASKHGVTVPDVASRWVLQQPAVGAVLVGTRLGVSDRCADALNVFGWVLSGEDLAAVDAFARGKEGEKLDAVYRKIGDCGQEYRGTRA